MMRMLRRHADVHTRTVLPMLTHSQLAHKRFTFPERVTRTLTTARAPWHHSSITHALTRLREWLIPTLRVAGRN